MGIENVAVYIDGQNLHCGIRRISNESHTGFNFDLPYFIKKITKGRGLLEVNYFYSEISTMGKQDPRQKNMISNFLKKGWNCYESIHNFSEKNGMKTCTVKGDDVNLTIKTMERLLSDNPFDTAIFFTSDGDFIPLINTLHKHKKNTEIICFEDHVSQTLKDVCDDYQYIDLQVLEDFHTKYK